jgi:Cu-Zn family superoxide dismutase
MKKSCSLRSSILSVLAAVSVVAIAGCSSQGSNETGGAAVAGDVVMATATLAPTAGNKASGTVTFTMTEDGVSIEGTFSGLTPGEHGFHIHEKGDCSAPDASSAGGHFNPKGTPHAGPDSEVRHIGDLGNIDADANGNATYHRLDHHLVFEGEDSILGRAVIVHAGRDDYTTQPTGGSGVRVACGVIEPRE